jgi:coproporphyrinogen III oxidase-like Fe-S oxidoreductase
MLAAPPLTLYVHVPWCVRKCPYCDFNSHERQSELPERAYLDALLADLDQDLHWVRGRPLEAIFIGGGTPSLMSADFYAALFEGLRRRLNFSDDIEITLEANPGTLETGRFAGFRAAARRASSGP